jgi:hypothetical protein
VKRPLGVVDIDVHLGQGRVKKVVGGTETGFKGRLDQVRSCCQCYAACSVAAAVNLLQLHVRTVWTLLGWHEEAECGQQVHVVCHELRLSSIRV